ncbi:hypothetical protein AB0D08_26660 [Kitasatospora sp. NPDC048540]|uniref:hypothetical protein n=1 Tax=Kitasatospora sp. NPDC048540 TaxID=3155634 RepID=UPI0033D08C66
MDLVVRPEADPAQVLSVVTAAGGLLAHTLDGTVDDVRAYHDGPCDPGGFAAMGVAELVLHTHDICRGLGLDRQVPEHTSHYVLHWLFPDAPQEPDADAEDVLLWCTGRGELAGHPRRTSWEWRPAGPEWLD